MAESMHLDSTDLVGSLDGFENLEHISGDFDMNQSGMEDGKVILSHNEDAIDMMEVRPKEPLIVIKEETVVEKMDDEEMAENSEEMAISSSDIGSVMGKVNVGNILTVGGNEEGLESSQDLFSGDIIEEVVGSEEQIEDDAKMYEDMDTIDHFVEEEVISETVSDQIEEIVTEDVITEETVIDDCTEAILEQEVVSSQEMSQEPIVEEVVKTDAIPVSSKMVTPGIYVVATSNSNIVSAQSFLPKGAGGTRLVMSPVDGSSGGGQTIRLVATGGPSQNDDQTPLTTSGQTIRIVTSGSSTGQSKVVKNTARTITLAEARQMGLITSAKLNTLLPTTILPKPNAGSNLKAGTVVTTTPGSQVIRIPAGQALNNIHQIQLPTKQVQYVKLVNTGSKAGSQADTGGAKQIPMAFTGSILNPQQTTFKLLSIATAPGGGQRVLIPASSQPVVSVGQNASTQNTGGNLVVLPTHVIQAASTTPASSTPSVSTQQTVPLPPRSPQPQPPPIKKEVNASKGSPPAPSASPVPSSAKPVQANGRKASSSSSSASTVNTPTPIKTKEVIVPAGGGTGSLSMSAKNDSTAGIVIKTEPDVKPIKESWSPEESQLQTFEPNGIRPRKPCNCTKSMCLKLYCDCFANGEFCHQCNCTCCYNNLEHEEERQRAIKLCLERNPSAFRPKIGKSYLGSEERRHNKGCNCRRSGCLKNYCECYEAKIPCSKNCKCVGCKNVDSPFVLRRDDDPRVMSAVSGSSGGTLLRLIKADRESAAHSRPNPSPAYLSSIKQAYRMMSNEVVEATCQCLLAQAEDWERDNGDQVEGTTNSPSLDVAQSLILEEFNRCLVQIVDCVTKSTASIQGMT